MAQTCFGLRALTEYLIIAVHGRTLVNSYCHSHQAWDRPGRSLPCLSLLGAGLGLFPVKHGEGIKKRSLKSKRNSSNEGHISTL